ncbi:MAG: hypothetical protein ABSC19_16640 [Syntrophorhabdales bacterium]|jgi:hypothetical protein
MGRAFFILGSSLFASFDRVVLVERRQMELSGGRDVLFLRGDIEDESFLSGVLSAYAEGFVFVNLCSATDTYRIRATVSRWGGAYIDTSCSTIHGTDEHRYSRLMPHTFQPTRNSEPHFTCSGVNPGMVEIIARKIINETFPKGASFDVRFFENDRFWARLNDDKVGVAWSPETMVDEVILTPTFRIKDGRAVESDSPPTLKAKARWGSNTFEARLVGHEEIWNLRRLKGMTIENSCFAYTLREEIMSVLKGGPEVANRRLMIPGPGIPVSGTDTLAVQVVERSSGDCRTLAWTTDHAATWQRWGINGVQFQVASSLLFFLELLFRSGDWATGRVLCASDIPLELIGWDVADEFFTKYDIEWKDANDLGLGVEE